MGLDTRSHSSLWKDRACVELNAAVLYTFQVISDAFQKEHDVTQVDMSAAL